jgi:hypothetical protein
MVDEVDRRILSAARGARRADAAALARKRHERLMPARAAADAGEAAGEDAAVDEAIELALDQPGDQVASTSDGSTERRAMVTDRAVQRGVLDLTRAIARRQWGARLGAAAVPVPSAGQRGVSDRVHPCTAV